jgi:7-cyano-7-deazaguanine synthase
MLVSPDGSATGILLSGGLDSAILAARLLDDGHEVQPFYVRSGVIWETRELAAATQFLAARHTARLRPLVVLDMPVRDVYAGHWSVTGAGTPGADTPDDAVYLPGRNALLLVKAAVWCQLHGVRRLALAPLGTSPFADASTEFIQRFQSAVNCGAPTHLEIVLPFARMNKRQVMQMGRGYPLQHTFSCISPVESLHCGQCNKCAERREAFRAAELADPTTYAKPQD